MRSQPSDKKAAAAPKTAKPAASATQAGKSKLPTIAQQPHKVAFPKKNQAPSAATFAARLPLALGKHFEMARTFLLKQKGIKEDVYFYGPKTGWALRYLRDEQPLCALMLHGDSPVAIVSLAAAAAEAVDWKNLSAVGQLAYKHAHGSPSLLWLDIPLARTGVADFKNILRIKLSTDC